MTLPELPVPLVSVRWLEAHIDEDHPDLRGKYSRDQILEMAHDH